MDMEDMRTDPMVYIDPKQFKENILDSVPTLVYTWLLADFFSKQCEEQKKNIIQIANEFNDFQKKELKKMEDKALYRAKSLFNKEWVQGSYVSYDFLNDGLIYPDTITKEYVDENGFRAIEPVHVDKTTVCKYSGLKDILGEKIFEGDIVETNELCNRMHEIACVRYGAECYEVGCYMDDSDGYIGFYLEASIENPMSRNDIRFWLNNYGLRVIGNIYDDIELAKKHGF